MAMSIPSVVSAISLEKIAVSTSTAAFEAQYAPYPGKCRGVALVEKLMIFPSGFIRRSIANIQSQADFCKPLVNNTINPSDAVGCVNIASRSIV